MGTPLIERKTYASFMRAGTFLTEDYELPHGHRDPQVPLLGGWPEGMIAVRFYDMVLVEVEDPLTHLRVSCSSEHLNEDKGWNYLRGKLYTYNDVQTKQRHPATRARQLRQFDSWGCRYMLITEDKMERPFYKERIECWWCCHDRDPFLQQEQERMGLDVQLQPPCLHARRQGVENL